MLRHGWASMGARVRCLSLGYWWAFPVPQTLSPGPSLHWRVEGKWAVTGDGGGEGYLIRQPLVPSMGLATAVGPETEGPVRKGSWTMPCPPLSSCGVCFQSSTQAQEVSPVDVATEAQSTWLYGAGV